MNDYTKVIIEALKKWTSKRFTALDEKINNEVTVLDEKINNKVDSVNGLTGDVVIDIPNIPEQVQTDWNVEDISSPEHIKNRPFYTYEGLVPVWNQNVETQKYYFGGKEFLFDKDTEYTVRMEDSSGKVVTVTSKWKEQDYNTTTGENFDYFGNNPAKTVSGEVDNGFYFLFFPGKPANLSDCHYIEFKENYGWTLPVNVSISSMSEIVVPLDEKYIPHTIARTSETVQYIEQDVTDEQKAQARKNIGVDNVDWNQNNPSAPDYVKNRTHYVDESETVLCEWNDLSLTKVGEGRYQLNKTEAIPFIPVVGEEYVVWYNGKRYVCVADRLGGSENFVDLGNLHIANEELHPIDTEEPFLIHIVAGNGWYSIQSRTDSEIANLRISKVTETIHKLDAKYLPDEALAQSDWSQTDETQPDYIKNKPEIATDDEIIALLAQEDMIPVVTDSDGSILADENDNILLW